MGHDGLTVRIESAFPRAGAGLSRDAESSAGVGMFCMRTLPASYLRAGVE